MMSDALHDDEAAYRVPIPLDPYADYKGPFGDSYNNCTAKLNESLQKWFRHREAIEADRTSLEHKERLFAMEPDSRRQACIEELRRNLSNEEQLLVEEEQKLDALHEELANLKQSIDEVVALREELADLVALREELADLKQSIEEAKQKFDAVDKLQELELAALREELANLKRSIDEAN